MKRSFLSVLICCSALVLTVLAIFVGVSLQRADDTPAFKDVTVELGTPSLGIRDFLTDPSNTAGAAFVSDVRLLDLGSVGTTSVTLRKGQSLQTVTLTVQDTTAPRVDFLQELTVALDQVPTPQDLIAAISDCSPTTAAFSVAPAEADDHSDQQVTVTVTDLYGNTTTGTSTLHFDWIRSEVQVELGTELTKGHILMDPVGDDALITQEAINEINQGGAGKYTLTVQSGSSIRSCSITVQDTQPPVLELKQVSIYPDRTCKLEDFVVSATDVSGDVSLELLTELPFGKEGDHRVQIKATDKNGLSTTVETACLIST